MPGGSRGGHKVKGRRFAKFLAEYEFPEHEECLSAKPDERGEGEIVSGGGDDCTEKNDILGKSTSAVDDDVPHIGQEEEDER